MAAKANHEETQQRNLRVTDVVEEPLGFIAPICGYEDMPLVSLELAIEPLVPILPTVQSHAYVAMQKSRKPADGLTQDESASIMLYTMGWEPLEKCLYFVLNNVLRSPNRQQKLKPFYLFLRLFLHALHRLPSTSKMIFRGVRLDLSSRYIEGETIVWWGFSSCTTTVGVLESNIFMGMDGPRTMFNIQCLAAKDIRKHSYFPNEDEVLLMAGTQFKVISCLNQGNLKIIQLEETIPPHPLLQLAPIVESVSINSSATTGTERTQQKHPSCC